MKKIALILALILVSLFIMVGCDWICDKKETTDGDNIVDVNDNKNDDTDSDGKEQLPEKLPTLEELIALNKYEEIFKTHENLYIKSASNMDSEEGILEDIVLFQGDDKID